MFDAITGYLRFELWGLLNIAAGVFNLALGLMILAKNHREKVNRAYFLVTVTAFVWVGGFGMASLVRNAGDADIWSRLAYVFGVPFISPMVYHFSAVWTGNVKAQRLLTYNVMAATVLAAIWFFVPELVWTNRELQWGNRYTTYTLSPFSTAYVTTLITLLLVLAILAQRNFFFAYKKEKDPFRQSQLRWIMVGYGIAYTGTIDFVTSTTGQVYPAGFVSLTILTTIVAYTIVRHRFLDVKIVVRKVTLAVTIYAALLVAVLLVGVPTIKEFIEPSTDGFVIKVVLLSVAMALILSLGPMIYAYFVRNSFWLRTHASAGLTHELKSPLATIESALEEATTVLRQPQPNVNRSLEYLDLVQRNSARLNLFVSNLLAVLKISEHALEIHKTPVHVSQCVHQVLGQYDHLLKKKGLLCTADVDPGIVVNADEEKFRQILSNLVSNAIKFSSNATIGIKTVRKNGHAVFEVKDSGAGLGKNEVERVFKRFYQAGKPGSGTGLGLAIAKAWVEAHGGRIWAESEGEGKGTTVTFTVPA